MAISEYTRLDSTAFAHKVSRKIAGWYSNTTFHENAVKKCQRDR